MYCEVTEKSPSVTLTPTLIKSLNSSTSRTNDLNSPPVPEDINTDPDDGINTNQDAVDGSENVYAIIQESLKPSMFIKAEGTKIYEGEDIYAPAYDLFTLNSTCPNATLSFQPHNIKKSRLSEQATSGKSILLIL